MEQQSVGLELRTLSNLLQRQARSSIIHQTDNVTRTNGWVIRFLAEHAGQDIFQRDLEELFSMRRSTASNILQLMEKKGFITRESVDYDARLKKLVLTPKALEFHKAATEEMNALEAQLTHGLTDEELSAFFTITAKIKQNLLETAGMEPSGHGNTAGIRHVHAHAHGSFPNGGISHRGNTD